MSVTFSDFKLDAAIQRGIDGAGFVEPRPIQAGTIPATLAGRDILGLAQTGTGKTAAFALPILEQLLSRRGSGPRVLIVAPTRELAAQISEEIRTLARYTNIHVATIFGGVSLNPQVKALRDRPEIIVACPGRLLDLMRQGALRLDKIETLVLDEADHMFDMGFLPDVRRILAACPKNRQNLLFSATMPREIRHLADEVLNDPFIVELEHSRPASTIEHALYPVDESQKMSLLEHLLTENGFVSAIVFTRTKHRAKRLALRLEKLGRKAIALQGNMSQNQRDRAMNGFRKHEFEILVATDIAARGLDVEQVSHVINFDMPNTADAYTHRIGRTGRSEREGMAYTFVTSDDHAMVRAVERKVGKSIPHRKVEGMTEITLDTSRPARPVQNRRRPSEGGRPSGRAASNGGRSGSRARPAGGSSASNASRPATGTRSAGDSRSSGDTRSATGARSATENRAVSGNRPASGGRSAPGNRPVSGDRTATGNRPAAANRSTSGTGEAGTAGRPRRNRNRRPRAQQAS